MSVKTEIERIEQAKADIRTAISDKGEIVPPSETVSTYADHIRNIPSGPVTGAVIDDGNVSDKKVWSSQKVSESLKGQFDDSVTSKEKGWSSDKIMEYAMPATYNPFDDSAVSREKGWSSQKIKDSTLAYGSGAGIANSYVHEYSLGDHLTLEQSEDIRSGRFKLVRVGGYWTINGRKYWAAHADYRLHQGETELTAHHMLVLPDKSFFSAKMNAFSDTGGGYIGSDMYTKELPKVMGMIETDFGASHILTYSDKLTNASSGGHGSGWAWVNDRKIDLMTESMALGSLAFGNSFDIGVNKAQLALFRARPDLIAYRGVFYWLRDIASATGYSYIGLRGEVANNAAAASGGVRPAFLVY